MPSPYNTPRHPGTVDLRQHDAPLVTAVDHSQTVDLRQYDTLLVTVVDTSNMGLMELVC